jgi:hypothetical protein
MVAYSLTVNVQDTKIVWTRSYAVMAILSMALVMGFGMNPEAAQGALWGQGRGGWRGGGRTNKYRSSDEVGADDDTGGIELQNGSGKRDWGRMEDEQEGDQGDEENGEGREVGGITMTTGRPSLAILRELARGGKVFGVFVCGPRGLVDEVREASAAKVFKCGGTTIVNPQIISNGHVYEEVFEW